MNLLWQQISLLAVLLGFLLWKHRLQVKAQRRADSTRLRGHGFESAELKVRLSKLRDPHQEISFQRRRHTAAREQYVTAVRKSLLRLSFFQHGDRSETSSPNDH